MYNANTNFPKNKVHHTGIYNIRCLDINSAYQRVIVKICLAYLQILYFSLVLFTSTDPSQQFSAPFKAGNSRQAQTCYIP